MSPPHSPAQPGTGVQCRPFRVCPHDRWHTSLSLVLFRPHLNHPPHPHPCVEGAVHSWGCRCAQAGASWEWLQPMRCLKRAKGYQSVLSPSLTADAVLEKGRGGKATGHPGPSTGPTSHPLTSQKEEGSPCSVRTCPDPWVQASDHQTDTGSLPSSKTMPPVPNVPSPRNPWANLPSPP